MKVIEFKPRASPNADAVALLEQVLEEARAGIITSVALAYVRNDSTASGTWSSTDHAPALLGAISRLHHAYNLELDETYPDK